MGWLAEYEWTSPMQTGVSSWEKFLAKCYPSENINSAALFKEFKRGATTPSEKYIQRPGKKATKQNGGS